MKRSAFFLILLLLGTRLNFAEDRVLPKGGISVAKILDGYVSATGGPSAHKELSALKITGDFGFTRLHPLGDYTFLYKAPAKDLLEVQMKSHGTSWFGRREDHRIRRQTLQGAAMINGAGMQLVENCLVSLLQPDTSDYSKVELIGRAEVDNRWAYAVRFTPKQGDPDIRYYDMENYLLVRMDQVQRYSPANSLPETTYRVTSYFRDYREVDGLRLPRQIVIDRGVSGDLIFQIARVKTGVEIPDSEFRD